jgi:aminomethyltransferase
MELKKVVLNDLHAELGAKMVSFAGFNMPVRYSSDIEEHKCVREAVGVFDVSHMGEFSVKGPGALDLIQRIVSNDAAKLFDGKIQYACFPNETGGIVDDLLVYKIADEDYMLVVNAGNIDKDWAWVNKFNTFGVKLENMSDQISLFAVQGPKAVDVIQQLTAVNLKEMDYYTFTKATFAGIEGVTISATGYTGAGGFEIYVPNISARKAWDAIFEAGAAYGIKPIGLGARDTLRLEKGYCLYGNDIDDTTSPIEAGLGWVTKFNKSFTNSEALLKQKEAGVSRKLIGFKMIERGIPRSHYDIVDAQGNKIGDVTSGTQSPMLGIGIGMGYVKPEFASVGSAIFILIRDKQIKAEVVKFPFV